MRRMYDKKQLEKLIEEKAKEGIKWPYVLQGTFATVDDNFVIQTILLPHNANFNSISATAYSATAILNLTINLIDETIYDLDEGQFISLDSAVIEVIDITSEEKLYYIEI